MTNLRFRILRELFNKWSLVQKLERIMLSSLYRKTTTIILLNFKIVHLQQY